MGITALWRRSHSFSAFYLLSCAVVVMLITFTMENIILPSKCSECKVPSEDRYGPVGMLSIDRLRTLVRPPFKDLMLESLGEDWDSSETRRKVEVEVEKEVLNDLSVPSSNARQPADDEISDARGSAKEFQVDVNMKLELKEGVILDSSAFSENRSKGGLGEGLETHLDGTLNTTTLEKPVFQESSDGQQAEVSSPAPPPPSHTHSVWYYRKVYKHPEAKLRLLTAEDGAAPIRSNIPPPDREITIVTQTSADRLGALEATCMIWGGALCVAVHVRLESQVAPVYALLKQMHTRVEEQGRCRLDIQVVTEDGFQTEDEALRALYPVNALRNVAMRMATTKLIFLLDADFKTSPRLHESLTEDEGVYQRLLKQATEEKQLFVVAAFEAIYSKDRHENFTVPANMEDLKEGWQKGRIDCFHCVKSPTGHIPTNFTAFFNAATTSPYPIPYRDGFEPYVIGAAAAMPLYDARFRGYGENKVSHLYACAAAGMGFQVIPNSFVFELPHPPSQAHESYIGKHKDPDQRYRILGLYYRFKHEVETEQMKKDPVRYRQFLHNLKRKLM